MYYTLPLPLLMREKKKEEKENNQEVEGNFSVVSFQSEKSK